MFESILFYAGLGLVLAGALSLVYPLRWLRIRTRGAALLVMAAGFLVIAIGAGMVDSYAAYLGFTLFFAGLVSVIRPLRFVYIRTRLAAFVVAGAGLLLALGALLLPYGEKEAITHTTKLDDWMPGRAVGGGHSIPW